MPETNEFELRSLNVSGFGYSSILPNRTTKDPLPRPSYLRGSKTLLSGSTYRYKLLWRYPDTQRRSLSFSVRVDRIDTPNTPIKFISQSEVNDSPFTVDLPGGSGEKYRFSVQTRHANGFLSPERSAIAL